MIDIHCHIVPGVDDGATDVAMAEAMLVEAKKQGITAIATTPHYVPGADDDETLELHQSQLDSIINRHDVELMLSREVRVNSSLLEYESYHDLTYGGKGKYILLELPTQEVPGYLEQLLFTLRLDGITPIIAHPERNMGLLHEPRKILELVATGAHLQLTTSSISGGLGPTIKHFSDALLINGLVSFVASDAHNLSTRPFTDWQPALVAMSGIGLTDDQIDLICTVNPNSVFRSTELAPFEITSTIEKAFLDSASHKTSLGTKKRKRFFFL